MLIQFPDLKTYKQIPIRGCAFNSSKKLEYPLLTESDRGVFIFCIELNGNNGHVLDIVYINGYSITKKLNLGDTVITYSVYNKHLIVECPQEWSYGVVASNFLK